MEQNTQFSESSAEIKPNSESESIVYGSKKRINKKIILLVTIILIIIGSGTVYFLFLNKEDDNKLSENDDAIVLEDEKEVEINKELDSDQDRLPDHLEKILGTDLNKIDTDGDSYSDFDEIKNGYNPVGDEKYTEKEWGVIKENIKSEDEKLYKEMFGDIDETGQILSCDAFPDKLDLCESFSCKFEHMFTGEVMEKKIIGLVDGKCQYTEEMPNGGEMNCKYSEDTRKAVAQYYRDIALAESAGTNIEADLSDGDVKTTYTIDGKEVENPLQEAMDNGQCVILEHKSSTQDNKCPPGTEYRGETYTYENGEQIVHPICSDLNFVCPSCDNCVSGMTKRIFIYGKEICSECLFDKSCKEGFHCSDHRCISD